MSFWDKGIDLELFMDKKKADEYRCNMYVYTEYSQYKQIMTLNVFLNYSCDKVMNDPTDICCSKQHIFCYNCIQTCYTYENKVECPLCREKITSTFIKESQYFKSGRIVFFGTSNFSVGPRK